MSLASTIFETSYSFPGQTGFYRGKVRDVYHLGDRLAVVATDRISAFDFILPRQIPFKGQILNQIAAKFLKETQHLVPNWLLETPDPNVSIGLRCDPYPVEMVIRGYLTGHAWREYNLGKRALCGVALAEGLSENDRLPEPIITPATKAEEGHDEDISPQEIIDRELVPESEYLLIEKYTKDLFDYGTSFAHGQGLILVDTKYEFGKRNGKIYLLDEIHTPDSSRYFYLDGYKKRQEQGDQQKHLSKEFTRQWLIDNGFQGLPGQVVPKISDVIVELISQRYIELFTKVTGEDLKTYDSGSLEGRIEQNILRSIS